MMPESGPGPSSSDASTERAKPAKPAESTAPPDSTERRVVKPWGHELIWVQTDRFAGKVLVIEAGKRLSLQLHEHKDEAIRVISGRLRLYLGKPDGTLGTMELGPGESRRIPVGMVHRFEAIERCELIEVSTPELDDAFFVGHLAVLYGSVSEIIREALRLFEAYQTAQGANFASLKADIAQGMADVHAGRVSAMDMTAIKAQGRAALWAKTHAA